MNEGNGPRTRIPRRQRRERGSITPEEILNSAFAVAAELSLDKLNMPSLAKHLDVGVTSLYWHFHTRDDLLNAMVERALERYHFALPFLKDGKWDRSLAAHARSMRKIFREDRVLCDLLVMRSAIGAQGTSLAFQRIEDAVAKLVDAGFTATEALDTYLALSVHTRGIVMIERIQDDHPPQARETSRKAVDPDSMPLIARLTARRGATVDLVGERAFEVGLKAIIERAQRILEAKGPRARVRQPRQPVPHRAHRLT